MIHLLGFVRQDGFSNEWSARFERTFLSLRDYIMFISVKAIIIIFFLEVITQASAAGRMAQFTQCFCFDLPDTFTRNIEVVAHFL